jgi:hypothetical protein
MQLVRVSAVELAAMNVQLERIKWLPFYQGAYSIGGAQYFSTTMVWLLQLYLVSFLTVSNRKLIMQNTIGSGFGLLIGCQTEKERHITCSPSELAHHTTYMSIVLDDK